MDQPQMLNHTTRRIIHYFSRRRKPPGENSFYTERSSCTADRVSRITSSVGGLSSWMAVDRMERIAQDCRALIVRRSAVSFALVSKVWPLMLPPRRLRSFWTATHRRSLSSVCCGLWPQNTIAPGIALCDQGTAPAGHRCN